MKKLIFAWLVLLASAMGQQPSQSADVIFVNAAIYPGAKQIANIAELPISHDTGCVNETRVRVDCDSIAISHGKVLSLGRQADVRKLAGPNTKIIDLHGAFVMPGFNDAHLHFGEAGAAKLNVNLEGVKSLAEMQQRIKDWAKTSPKGEWIVGHGWDHTKWPGQVLPMRLDLDQVTGNHPAVFVRIDGHIAVANSAALKAGGVTRETRDPEGGKVDHGEAGEPTGILRETARELVESKIPKVTKEKRRKAILLALADAAQWGITSAQDNSDWEDFLIYEQLEKEGKLTVRISEWLPFNLDVEKLKVARVHHPQDDPMLHTGMLKGFMDGSLGSRTAALLAPYSDDPINSGIPRYTQDQLNTMTVERAGAGFQIGFHAIGDRGTEMALTAYKLALNGAIDRRFRVEHAQVTNPKQVQEFKTLGVVASMQPNHLLTDMNWAKARLGEERAATSYAWKGFLAAGVPLAFGTDYPVEPITPFRGLYAAVTRKNEAGTEAYFPDQKLTIDQAIAAYTTGSAYAEFAETTKGTLTPGMLADFVVLDRDIMNIPADEILQAKVLRTVVGGRTVYQAPEQKSQSKAKH